MKVSKHMVIFQQATLLSRW